MAKENFRLQVKSDSGRTVRPPATHRPLLVKLLQPFSGDLPHLPQELSHIGIEHFSPINPTIALDEGILIGFPG